MRLFSAKPKTRSEILADADRARARGRVRKAVAGYRKALESDPADPSVNLKLGPLLAKLGDADGGARCFRIAAQRHLDAGFSDRAAAVNVAATGVFPLDAGFRLEVARLNVARGRKQDALASLLEGARALTRARRHEAAASLLSRALEIEPWHLETTLALVPLVARREGRSAASALLAGLDGRTRGAERRRVRWAALKLEPGPRTFWRWATAR